MLDHIGFPEGPKLAYGSRRPRLASRRIRCLCRVRTTLAFIGGGLGWHDLATLSTWGTTLVIQRAEHRDTQALHAKLDELLRVNGDAKNSLMTLDDKDAEEVEQERAAQFRS
jgi:hypothetical protein